MLTAAEIDDLLAEVLPAEVWASYRGMGLGEPLAQYLALLALWNTRVNLTSVRSPEEMVRRHVAESLCCAVALPACGPVLDLGSGAGFPGVPVQLMRPELLTTLAEAHGKKAAFLREVVRELGLRSEVYAGRAQELPERSFGGVCLRAVDPMAQGLRAAGTLARVCVCVIGSAELLGRYEAGLAGWRLEEQRACVSRGGSMIYIFGKAE